MKLWIAVAKEPDASGSHRTTCAYSSHQTAEAAASYWKVREGENCLIEIDLPDPESDEHRRWREKRAAFLCDLTYIVPSGSLFHVDVMKIHDSTYPEPPKAPT
jgi:hypothetical protein